MFEKAKIMGVDIDKKKLQTCKMLANELNIKNTAFAYFDVTKKQMETSYDLIVNIDVLEHIDRYEAVLENFSNLLKRGGYLYIHVPQSNQERIFGSLKEWHHEDHAREGISRKILEDDLRKLGFKIIVSRETFGLFGKLSWELNHLALAKSFFIVGVIFPILYIIAKIDLWQNNKNGLGIALLAKKE